MMNEVITIENTEMQIKEYNGQRVVTLKDIDAVHGKKTDTAKKSFQKHKKHFILGKHYFEITRKELGERYSPNEKIIGNPNIITYLFTERGYLMLVKAFTDDLSWQVQDRLVEVYFNAKEAALSYCTALAPEHKVSSVPAPRNTSWYAKNQWKIECLCKDAGCTKQKLFHFILSKLGEEYDLETARLQYIEENGYPPAYAMSIVDYFPEMEEKATYILERLCNSI